MLEISNSWGSCKSFILKQPSVMYCYSAGLYVYKELELESLRGSLAYPWSFTTTRLSQEKLIISSL